jgi:hypothetical protein
MGWETVVLVPTNRPLEALAIALVPLLEPTMGEVDRLKEAAKLAEHLRSGMISLCDIIERLFAMQSGSDRLLIVVDQFEELYTLTSDEKARRRFVDELLAASSSDRSRTNIALTLRGDFVGRAFAYRPLSDRLQDAQVNLGPMTRQELERAIRKPADRIQLEFESGSTPDRSPKMVRSEKPGSFGAGAEVYFRQPRNSREDSAATGVSGEIPAPTGLGSGRGSVCRDGRSYLWFLAKERGRKSKAGCRECEGRGQATGSNRQGDC